MQIAIIGAMEQEITFLLEQLGNYKISNYSKYTFYEGKLFGKDLVITNSGIGKVASGLLVATILNYYPNIDLLINIGVSGGLKDKVNLSDIVVANKLKYADADVTIFPHYEYGQMPNCPKVFPSNYKVIDSLNLELDYKLGMIISGDQFYHNENKVEKLIKNYFYNDNVLALDMESAALAHACWFFELSYLAIRAISDIIGSNFQKDEYNKNLEFACKNSNLFLLEVLKKL